MSHPDPHAASPSPARPWYKKKRWVIPLGFLALCVAVAPFTDSGTDSAKASSTSTTPTDPATAGETVAKTAEAVAQAEQPATQKPKPKKTKAVTSGERNALESAENYLDFQAFSRKGLIKQLKFEKFTTSEATYAADHVGANWNEQAVKSAENYLDTTSFSRPGLRHQLEFEGFTSAQAKHGVAEAY